MRSAPNITLSEAHSAWDALSAASGDFIDLRHWIHAHPEQAYQEHRTAELIAHHLRAWGWDVEEGIGETGVVGHMQFGNGNRTIGFRADIDALPIHETTGLPYASQNEGTMHACGHDGHTAILLGAAHALAHARNLCGAVTLVFQPAEEGRDGAQAMVTDGLFDRYSMDSIFGLHNLPGQPTGEISLKSGPFWAGSDAIEIELLGRSGHGAQPHLAKDVISAGAAMVQGLNTIVSRNVDPLNSAALTIGTFQAGAAWNVIPDHAVMHLSLRSFDAEVRAVLIERIRQVVSGVSEAMEIRSEVRVIHGCPPVTNDPGATNIALRASMTVFGDDKLVTDPEIMTLSDDFSVFQQHVPGVYIGIGNGVGSQQLHHPAYDFNDDILMTGAALWIGIAEQMLGQD